MLEIFTPLRELSAASICLRLFLAVVVGGVIGMERGRKGRAAGFRTYMIVCVGASLTMLLGQYQALMLATSWSELTQGLGADVSRISAQVINGVGFLGAGTIIVTGHKEVKGLTTAVGLWASACVGLAIGAGFYEGVLLGFLVILLSVCLLPAVENLLTETSRSMNIYVEFTSLDGVGSIVGRIKELGIHVYEMDINRSKDGDSTHPNAILSVRLQKKQVHSQVLASLSELETIRTIDEF